MIPLVGLTAWQALVERANLQPGHKVLIHAGSGGFGSLALQLAKHLGATVATTASTGTVKLVRGPGADVVIDYRNDRFETVLSGDDLVICGLDGDTLAKSQLVLKPGGKLISISGPSTPEFAKRQGLSWLLQQVMRLLSLCLSRYRASKRQGRGRPAPRRIIPTRDSNLFRMRPLVRNPMAGRLSVCDRCIAVLTTSMLVARRWNLAHSALSVARKDLAIKSWDQKSNYLRWLSRKKANGERDLAGKTCRFCSLRVPGGRIR